MTRFDLSEAARRYKSTIRFCRFLVAAILGVIIGGVVDLWILYHTRFSWGVGITGAIAVMAGLAVLYGLLVFRTLRPGAAYAEVDAQGLLLGYPDGRVLALSWGDPDLDLRLLRTSGTPDLVSRGAPVQAVLERGPLRSFLTPEALDSILSVSKREALRVREERWERQGWTQIVIQGTAHGPAPAAG